MRRGALLGIPGRKSLNVVLAMGLSAVIGGRLAWFVLRPPAHILDILDLSSGGLLFVGAALAGGLGGLAAIRWQGLPFFAMTDVLALGLPLAHGLFRIGCFLAGCCWGTPSDQPWAVVFHAPLGPAPDHVPLHPTQLYEACALLAVGLAARVMYKKRGWNGQIMALYLVSYGVIRAGLETLRGDAISVVGPVTLGQLGGLGLLALGIGVFGVLARRRSARVMTPIGYGQRDA